MQIFVGKINVSGSFKSIQKIFTGSVNQEYKAEYENSFQKNIDKNENASVNCWRDKYEIIDSKQNKEYGNCIK